MDSRPAVYTVSTRNIHSAKSKLSIAAPITRIQNSHTSPRDYKPFLIRYSYIHPITPRTTGNRALSFPLNNPQLTLTGICSIIMMFDENAIAATAR